MAQKRSRPAISVHHYPTPSRGPATPGVSSLSWTSSPTTSEPWPRSYTAAQFEQMRLFDVVDRIVELFLNGLLPIGFDSAGRALDQYLRSRPDRLTSAERRTLYARVLGLPGGDVADGVSPNSDFDDLFLRFGVNVAEFDRSDQSRCSRVAVLRWSKPRKPFATPDEI